MIIVPIMLRMYGMGIYGPGWPSTIDNSALNSIILHIMSIFTMTGSYKYSCTAVLPIDLKLKICECDMSLQTVESEGSRRKKEKEDRDDLRSENCSIDMIRVEEDQLVLLELGP